MGYSKVRGPRGIRALFRLEEDIVNESALISSGVTRSPKIIRHWMENYLLPVTIFKYTQ